MIAALAGPQDLAVLAVAAATVAVPVARWLRRPPTFTEQMGALRRTTERSIR